MLLGLSSLDDAATVEMEAVSGSENGDGGVAHGALLTDYAEKVHNGTVTATERTALAAAVGDAGLVDAAAVCANFNMMVRIADGTGTPLDAGTIPASEDLRQDLGLNELTSKRLADLER